MPIYEYHCKDCGHEFEELQKISDPAVEVCPECGKNTAEKLVSAAGFKLKGTGWYETDFKDNTAKKSTDDKTKKAEPNKTDSGQGNAKNDTSKRSTTESS